MASLATAFITLVPQLAPNATSLLSAESSKAGLAAGTSMGTSHSKSFDEEATKGTKAGVASAGRAASDEGKRHGASSGAVFGGAFSGAITGFLTGEVFVKVVDVFRKIREQAVESQKTLAQTNAVIASTKGVAGISAEALNQMANRISALTGKDDEYIQSAGNMLLTFTNVRGAIYKEALPAILDMSVALGTDATHAALIVGKALQDPIKGMTALRRAGVTFTDAQVEVIKKMQETGNIAGAQKLILAELTKEFGGSAAAQATAAEKLHVIWNNALEIIGTKLRPAVDSLATGLAAMFAAMSGEGITSTGFVGGMERLGVALMVVGHNVVTVGSWLITQLKPPLEAIVRFIVQLVTALVQSGYGFTALKVAVVSAALILVGFLEAITKLFNFLSSHIEAVRVFVQVLGTYVVLMAAGRTATLAWAAATVIARAATIAWAAPMAVLNALFMANPIGLTVIAITILVTAIILAYTHSALFRSIVQQTWAVLKDIAGWLVSAGVAAFHFIAAAIDFVIDHWKLFAYAASLALGPMGPLLIFVATHLNTFKAVALDVANAVIGAWQATSNFFATVVGGFVTGLHAIAEATLWLWRTIIEPTWNVIYQIINGVWLALKIIFVAFVVVLELLAEAHLKLFNITIKPIWDSIVILVTAAWNALKVIFTLTINFLTGPLSAAYNALKNFILEIFTTIRNFVQAWWDSEKALFNAVMIFLSGIFSTAWNTFKDFILNIFNLIKNAVQAWWNAELALFNTVIGFLAGPFSAAWNAIKDFVLAIFNTIRGAVQAWWDAETALFNSVIGFLGGVFSNAWASMKNNVLARWSEMQSGISAVWNSIRDNVFSPFVNFVTNTIPNAFNTGVESIKSIWHKIEDYAKAPVNFVINPVYSHIRDLWNGIASKVGVPQLPEQRQFARGGPVWGAGTATSDSIPAMLSHGEYVIKADSVKKLGSGFLDMLNAVGGPPANVRRPGDGSEGIAFADGGIVGWLKAKGQSIIRGSIAKVVQAFVNETINPLINQIPGSTDMWGGAMRGGAHKLVDGLLGWIKRDDAAHPPAAGGGGADFGPITASVKGAQDFVRAQAGKPYVWAAGGPGGYDCSGLVAAVYNLLRGKNPPYGHTFSTMDEANYFTPGDSGLFRVGWANAGERGGGDVGHTAGNIGGLAFEATPPVVKVGSVFAPYNSFAHIGHMAGLEDVSGVKGMARGGLVGEVFDRGGVLRPGHVGINLSGKPEAIETLDQIKARNEGSADVIDRLEKLIEAVYSIAPNVGGEINAIGRGLRLKGRTRGPIHGGF